jgi:hypothetical protein
MGNAKFHLLVPLHRLRFSVGGCRARRTSTLRLSRKKNLTLDGKKALAAN